MFNKEWSIEEVMRHKYGKDVHNTEPLLIAESNYYSEGKWDINYSSILTHLIQWTGRMCERFASDLFISWSSIVEELTEPDIDKTFLFGLREDGVDHTNWVLSRLNQYEGSRIYRKMFAITLRTEVSEYGWKCLKMELWEVRV